MSTLTLCDMVLAWMMEDYKFNSILQALRATQLRTGLCGINRARSYVENSARERFLSTCQHWKVCKAASPFRRRVTCARWHPRYLDVVAFGAHSGDILLWHYDRPSVSDPVISGVGMGYGCITEMKFHPDDPTFIYTSAVDGRFCLQDFEGRQSQVYLDTMEISYWWCSFDISRSHGLIIVGDNHGNAALLDSDGRSIGTYKRLHKEKIKHLEFCPARPWMMATASVDRTVALWDVRMLKEGAVKESPLLKSPKPISVMKHGGPVTSCYFDPIHGNRLLTTAQNEEIRVYDSHDGWEEPTVTVNHPHRHFQHMTDIRATWHPLYADLCVVGRYPGKEDDDKTRSVDLIDLVSGQRVGYFYNPRLSNIIQVNQFNSTGDCLASGMGYNALIWKVPTCIDFGGSLKAAQEEARSRGGRPIPLPHGTRAPRGSTATGTKRKRTPKDNDKDVKKKKLKTVGSQTSI